MASFRLNPDLDCEFGGEHPTNTPSNARTAERSSRSRSPRKALPSNASVVTDDSTRPRKDLPEQSCEDKPENRSQDDLDKLQTVLSHPHYQQLHRDLEESQNQYEDMLMEKDKQLAEIQSKAESDLREKDKQLEEARKGWKKLAGKLNKIRANVQEVDQATDAYLTEKTNSLRYSIRNFAIQYFDGEMKRNVTINQDFINCYVMPVMPLQPEPCLELFASPTDCSQLIEGVLWQTLIGWVFNRFEWAGKVAGDVKRLHQMLSPTSEDTPPNAEAERKFRTWSATTTSLLLEELDLKDGGDAYKRLERKKLAIRDYISKAIRAFARRDSGFSQQLLKIIGDAIALDLDLSKQVAQVIWVSDSRVFAACTTALKERESPETGENDVYLLVAPGLTKRGKSTGEDFNTETPLLPMSIASVYLDF